MSKSNSKLLNKCYYKVNEIQPKLNNINNYKNEILNEVTNLNKNDVNWFDWPENLYEKNKTWKVFPLNVFGKWSHKNCSKCPNLTNFLQSIPNLKLAILSKMSGGTILTPHQGWANLSNYSLRCHYGLIIPPKCCVKVIENNLCETKFHKQFEWIIFDDSKEHSAENLSDKDRIILLLDIERPKNIQIGLSTVKDTKELKDIVNIFNETN